MSNGTVGHSVPAARPSGGRRPRLVALDGLRITAALAVVVYHYMNSADKYWLGGSGHAFPGLREFTQFGWLGVDLFFMISGFVICMSSWDRGLGEFFVSRVTRLFPAYWFAVLLTSLVLFAWPSGVASLKPPQILANLTMAQTGVGAGNVDGPYWTLWPELLFYLLFALVIWRGVSYHRVVVFCVLWTAFGVIAWRSSSVFVQSLSPLYSMYFVAGIAMYLMYRFRPTLILWGLVGFSWLLAMYGISLRLPVMAVHIRHGWVYAAGIVTACFVLMLAASLGWLDRIQWRWLTTAGTLTYPLYLIHMSIGFTVISQLSGTMPKYVLLIGLIAGMLALSWLIHRLVEKPVARRLKRALTHGIADMRSNSSPALREHIPAARAEIVKPADSAAPVYNQS